MCSRSVQTRYRSSFVFFSFDPVVNYLRLGFQSKKKMPQRHSKNNNDLAFFTYDEKTQLGYGTRKERLGKDSIKPFDSCCLCLKAFIDSLCCQKDHVFLQECIFQSILSQKKDIKRWQACISRKLQHVYEQGFFLMHC